MCVSYLTNFWVWAKSVWDNNQQWKLTQGDSNCPGVLPMGKLNPSVEFFENLFICKDGLKRKLVKWFWQFDCWLYKVPKMDMNIFFVWNLYYKWMKTTYWCIWTEDCSHKWESSLLCLQCSSSGYKRGHHSCISCGCSVSTAQLNLKFTTNVT
jgi:hypothetical protein